MGDRGTLYVADSDSGRVQVVPVSGVLADADSLPSSLTDEERRPHAGSVVEFRAGAGYGFVEADGVRCFAHHTDILEEVMSGYPVLCRGERVRFLPRRDAKWGQRAAMI